MNLGLTHRMHAVVGGFELRSSLRGIQARRSERRTFRTAMGQAYTLVARHYRPRWASFLLDKEFQAASERRLVAAYLGGGPHIAAAELARMWADQVGWISEEARLQHMPELEDLADRFIRCLEQELCVGRTEWKGVSCAE